MQIDVQISEPSRLYVIGDIHGRADLLDRMIDAIARDLQSDPASNCLTVTLGDYVDRGPASRDVINCLMQNPFPTPYIALKGNHEVLFEEFLANPSTGDQWGQWGGMETVHSYGVDPVPMMMGRGCEVTARALAAAIPPEHSGFLSTLRSSLTVGRYFLCHAGLRPGVALHLQEERDLLWIRAEFLGCKEDFGKIIVHGHTPVEEPEVRRNRINIDTGAYITGRLTCAVLENERVRFLTAV